MMSPLRSLLLLLLLLLLGGVEPRKIPSVDANLETSETSSHKRVSRGAKEDLRKTDPRRFDGGFFTTPQTFRFTSAPLRNSTGGLLNPLTDASYWAYCVMLLALILFAAGIVGNLALMCIVWHNFYLKSAWNCILAGLAFWDFLVLFFCLPVVIFHELTLKRLLGDLSCRLVPYLEVTSLGVATFSLCALSIDRFHGATGSVSHQAVRVEPCQSILSKLWVIWLGSMVLASPELLLWQLLQEPVGLQPAASDHQPAASLMAALGARSFKVDVCVREPSEDLPESIYALVLTYQEARMWWMFGCYLCLPLLFTLACDLVTRQMLAQRLAHQPGGDKAVGKQRVREQRLRSTVMALAGLYAACNLPQSACAITLAYVSGPEALPALVVPALALVEQLLLFTRCSATPVLLLCLCRSLGQAFMDCCCCCCEECLPDSNSSTTATSALSSPTSPTPSSLAPSGKEEAVRMLLPAESNVYDREKDPAAAIGTPC